MIDHVTSSDGFTNIGWYKRGNINDHSNNDDSDNRVEFGEIGYHLVTQVMIQ